MKFQAMLEKLEVINSDLRWNIERSAKKYTNDTGYDYNILKYSCDQLAEFEGALKEIIDKFEVHGE